MKKSLAVLMSVTLASSAALTYAAGGVQASNDQTSANPAARAAMSDDATNNTAPNMDKVSYTIGYEIGHGFKSQNVDVDSASLSTGLKAGLSGQDSKYTKEQMQQIMQDFQKEMMSKAVEKQKEQGSENLKNATAGMAVIGKQSGMKELETGIYYKVITKGDGKVPTASDTVNVNYQGNILTADGSMGKEFDSSYKRNAPATFPVGQVIPCWTKILEKMPVGSTWQIYCSPDQAYGKFAPPTIGPNQALTFKVELLSIKDSGSANADSTPAANTGS